MSLDAVDLQQITDDIWSAVLGLTLKPNPAVDRHAPDQRIVTGSVQITGDWNGVVTIECTSAHARAATAAMFGMDLDEVTHDEIVDSVGELANMAGGNAKSVIGGTCQLSLPSVTEGLDYHVSVPGSRLVDRQGFDCDGELLVVSILERQTG